MGRTRSDGNAATRGAALLVTLSFLAMFACLIVALVILSDMNLMAARNRLQTRQAESLAEAGLNLVQLHLSGLSVSTDCTTEQLHGEMAAHLDPIWAGLAGEATGATYNASGVFLARTEATAGGTGTGTIDVTISSDGGAADSPTITVESTGRFGRAVRKACYTMATQSSMAILGQYGIASKSAIQMLGNPAITGVNRASEGSILSATEITLDAVDLTGQVNISGDVAVTNPDAQIIKKGNVKIGGDQFVGAAPPSWPETDPDLFKPYATNVYTGSEGDTLTNVRIPAGTNPTFNADMTLMGVTYIESPNVVKFNGNAQVCGVIVADKPATPDLSTNEITFAGTVSATGVEGLPAGSEFDGLRDKVGTFVLAEGFNLTFTGNFNTINGSIVGSGFTFSGNAGGTIRGTVVNLADSAFVVDGDVNILIDKTNSPGMPTGVIDRYFVMCVAGSYHE